MPTKTKNDTPPPSPTKKTGHALALGTIAWSTYASTRLFEKALNMSQQRWLVAYPVGLVYSIFVLITIF